MIQFKKLHPDRIVYDLVQATGKLKEKYKYIVYPLKVIQRDDFNERVLVEDHQGHTEWIGKRKAITWHSSPGNESIYMVGENKKKFYWRV